MQMTVFSFFSHHSWVLLPAVVAVMYVALRGRQKLNSCMGGGRGGGGRSHFPSSAGFCVGEQPGVRCGESKKTGRTWVC